MSGSLATDLNARSTGTCCTHVFALHMCLARQSADAMTSVLTICSLRPGAQSFQNCSDKPTERGAGSAFRISSARASHKAQASRALATCHRIGALQLTAATFFRMPTTQPRRTPLPFQPMRQWPSRSIWFLTAESAPISTLASMLALVWRARTIRVPENKGLGLGWRLL